MNTPTFQELLAQLSQTVFIGRSALLRLFEHTINQTRPPFLVLMVQGEAGIGKTAVLHQFQHIAHSYHIPTTLTNQREDNISKTLLSMSQQLEEQGITCPHFDEAFRPNNLDVTSSFLSDLNQCASQRRVVLMFDEYEQTNLYLDGWLRQIMAGRYGIFSSNILFVLAGREPLGEDWRGFGNALHTIQLPPLNNSESHQLLQTMGVYDDLRTRHILRRAKGNPYQLKTFAQQQHPEQDGQLNLAQGWAFLEAKAYPQALKQFSRAIEKQPLNVLYYHWRGLAYRKLQDYESAIADFTKAILLQPNNGTHYWGRGYTYQQAKEYESAIADFSQAILLQPQNPSFYHWRAKAYAALRQTHKAQSDVAQMQALLATIPA